MERIHVSVRARPLSTEDAKTSPWKISSDSIFMPNHPSPAFEFDRIFREDCKTVQVYEARTKEIVAAAVRGFNGTVFAYGQTNSGKTHTMRGSSSEPGVIPLAVHDLFDTLDQDASREFLLRMSYLEIYNEDINDLLAPEHRKLQIHENLEKGIFVAGLREEIVASPQQVLEMMEFGESHRHIGETNMNLYSSRSHTIFRMIIESRQKMQDEGVGNACDAVRVSVLNLVDLAGSERASKTGAEGVRLKEGSHINKSLMTLGTVIKKLSEGVESQGGHVPYRDSKLTRILQPALGGNANTAIICNITLAPIHADETKSSLQFASRALRVTNCAHVNEILTDAALLKRQKKEIEELRSKLKASHSDHSEEEILNLRNTLLKSELERERIALELEEEKKAQAQRERVLQEQAKKIKNLSSMVLLSNRDEKRETGHLKKGKRRDTWCPGNLSRDSTPEVESNVLSRGSSLKSVRPEREIGPLLPFAELDEVKFLDNISEQDEDSINETLEDSALPDPHALMHVTSRKKPSASQRSPIVVGNELDRIQREYEDLLLQYETEIISNEIQIECFKRKLGEDDLSGEAKCKQLECGVVGNVHSDETSVNLSDPKDILLIKQLQEKINMLEMEKSSSQQNLDDLVTVATEQNVCAREKIAEIQEEIYAAREEARAAGEEAQVAREQLVSKESEVINLQEEIYAAKEETKVAREETKVAREEDQVACEQLVSKHQEEIYAAREETKAAKEEAQVAREQLVSKESEVINLQEEIYAAREETKAAREEAQVACEQLVSKESEVNNLQEEIYAAREETKAAREEAQVTREQLVSKESELQEEIYASREETKAAREEAQVVREQLVSKESEVNNLQEEIYASREETRAAKEEAQVTREQLVSKESKVINLHEEIYAAREETKAAREEAQVTREQLVSKESEVINVRKLQEEIYAAREEARAAREEARAAGEETKAAKEEAQVVREQLASKESEVNNLQEEVYAAREETKAAREEAQVVREQLVSKESEVINVSNENFNSLVNIGTDFEDLVSEFEDSRASVATISSVMDEVLEDFAFFSPLLQDFTLFMRQSFEQHASLISSYQNAQSCLKQKVLDIEDEKLLLQEQCAGLQSQIDELNEEDQKHKTSLMNLSERHESEMSDLLSHIEGLEKNIASLSSSSLAKEKENLRKDFEKTKTKLKDTESKLKNVMQDKTKLEAEKASAERELKRLHSQKALLERDISKQESFAGKRHDSLIVERSANQSLQEEYKNLEVLAIEMESTIASLEEELAVERGEKEEALSRNDGLYSEITSLTEKLEHSNSHLEHLQKDVMELKTRLEESSSDQQQLETSVKKLLEEKEELAMHLANSLLEMEEEKAIWSSKEQASTDAMEEKIRLYSIQIESISKEMSEAKKELESCRLECVTLADRLRCCEENVNQEKERSMEKSLEIDRLGDELRSAQAVSKQSQEDADADSIEKAKLKMRLRGTQARYDAISLRHKQSMNELEVMNRKFEEASAKLKEKLASKALEVLDLKKQISVLSRTM